MIGNGAASFHPAFLIARNVYIGYNCGRFNGGYGWENVAVGWNAMVGRIENDGTMGPSGNVCIGSHAGASLRRDRKDGS